MSDGKGGDDLRVFDDLVAGKGWSLAPDAPQPSAAASPVEVEVIPDPFASPLPKGMPPLPASMPPLPGAAAASARPAGMPPLPAGMPPLPATMPPLPNLSLDEDPDDDTAAHHYAGAAEVDAIEAQHAAEEQHATEEQETVEAEHVTEVPDSENLEA